MSPGDGEAVREREAEIDGVRDEKVKAECDNLDVINP